MSDSHDLVIYNFSREKVLKKDYSHFLSVFGPAVLPDGPPLRRLCNSLRLAVDGYTDDPREVSTIPEIREFYSALLTEWPYLLYFANLDGEEFLLTVLCCLTSINVAQVAGYNRAMNAFDPLELVDLFKRQFGPMNALCERAGMSELEIYQRTRALFLYFQLPFEEPPPV